MSAWDWLQDKTGELWGEFEKQTGFAPPPLHSYIAEVTTGLWRCSWPDDQMLAYLATQGVHYVVNLCAEMKEDDAVKAHNMDPIYLPEIDGTAVHMYQVKEFLGYVEMASTCVHCRAGHGRTGQYVAAYRVLKQGWTPTAALIEARSYGHLEPDQIRFIQNLGA